MDIKMILVDIDGTLLNSEHQVTQKTRETIAKLKDVNIAFAIATGRSPYAVEGLLEEWGLKEDTDYILGFNGSSLYNCHTKDMVSFYPLDQQAIQDIIHDTKDFNRNAGIYDQYTYHALYENDMVKNIAEMNHFDFIVDDLSHYKSANKVLVTAEKEEMDKIVHLYDTYTPSTYHVFRSADILLECVNPNISKSKGIAALAKELHYTKDNIMTFGDMMNDYEMIRDYVGVAMGNADDRVKEVAKYITKSNDEDGIAVFIEEYLL